MKNKTGFTLIELIIYITTFAIVAVFLILFVFNLIDVQTKIKISKEVLENSQRAMEIMLWHIRHSQNVYLPTSSFGSHPGQLSLETAQNKPQGEETTYLDFYLDENGRICFKQEESEAVALTSEKIKINNLVFNYLIDSNNNKSVRIELSAIYNHPGGGITYQATSTLVSTANLRND
ncbi:MAG: type II secretion system protein [Patescibacteria group bacterium]